MEKSPGSRNQLDQLETMMLIDAVRAHCHRGSDGYAVYDDGWDDERIADESKGMFTLSNVSGFRSKFAGSLRATKPPTAAEMIETLETRVVALEKRVVELTAFAIEIAWWANKRKPPVFGHKIMANTGPERLAAELAP